jgi:enoyl-CoA hydratase/carnithine racemase
MQFAMPETGIGLFPDVGGSFFLPRLPGEIGMYLGLTGARLKMADALYAGIATHVAPAVEREALIARLAAGEMPDNVLGAPGGAIGTPPLAELRTKIDTIFSAPSVEVVLERLERDGTDWAADTAKTIRTKSPTASKLAFRQIREGKALDFDACMRMEFRMVSRVIAAHDFYEGVRATIIDKDGAPKWQPDSLVRVSDTAIEAYFAPLPDDGEPQGALDKVLHIDARGWTQVTDIYDALLAAVDASRNHGCSIDALIDSMVYGGMNGIEAPYTVRVTETAALPPEVREELQLIVDTISGAQGTDGDVAFRIEP